MKILIEKPPIYDDICKVFDCEREKPIFAWGTIIYNPFNHDLVGAKPELIAHEEMHGFRQIGHPLRFDKLTVADDEKIRLWWRDYLESASFRLEEEIPAHRAEYRQLLRMYDGGNNRKERRRWLPHVAKRMRNPLYKYNHLFTFEQAKRFIELDETEMKG